MKSHTTGFMRAGIAVAVLTALGWLGGCSDTPNGPVDDRVLEGLIVSDPVKTAGVAAGARIALALAGSAADDVAYVSLAPGTVPSGSLAIIRRLGDVGSTFTTVFDGGFDPVPVDAQPGDSIEVRVQDASGARLFQARRAVAAGRPPVVVRSEPPRGKTDVAVNASIVIVFSEPVAAGSLTSTSVQLFRGTARVAGTVSLLQGTGAAIVFTPDVLLDRNTAYRFIVTRAVRDLDGDALATGVTMEFTTGQSSTGPAASITVSPDTVYLTGATYQMTATVRDAVGNELIDQPITWSTNDPAGVTVSPTGLVTALGVAGSYEVTAMVNGLDAGARVIVPAGPPAAVTLSRTQATVGAAGDTIKLTATVRDAAGRLLDHPSVNWTSSDVALATVAVDSSGAAGLAFATVTGVSPGSATITATSGTASGRTSVTVISALPVASVTVTPTSATLVVQGRTQLSAVARDANGKVLAGRPIAWTTDNATVATADANGLVTGVGLGSAAVTATSEGVSDTAAITVTAITFGSVSSGGSHTCGVTPNGAAYCWGDNQYGELGTGRDTGPERCGDPFSGEWPCSKVPVAVTGDLIVSAATLTAGNLHTCGLTASGAAYCWGYNGESELGDGTRTNRASPVAVQGGLSFAAVSAGADHTCGVTAAGAAYCWGGNAYGQLGASTTFIQESPVAVQGELSFATVSAGTLHTCGVTTGGPAYCWGEGYSSTPVAVSGGLSFTAVASGYRYTCGLTNAGAAYCWGYNFYGQLGDGSTTESPTPVAVLGGFSFAAVSAGHDHTCGVTTGGAAYCWGYNFYGQLGDGSYTDSPTPAAVQGGLTFAAVSASVGQAGHTCGVTTGGATYCWGFNYSGQLGDGTRSPNGGRYSSAVPVKVAGQP